MAKYYIQFETMIRLIEIPPTASVQDLLLTLCKSNEFKEFNMAPISI